MNTIDKTDRKILTILQDNARITNKELASHLGLSPPPTLERVKKLEKLGYIKDYIAILDAKKLDLGTTLMVSVVLHRHSPESINDFYLALENLPEVMECYHLTGEDDFLLKVICKDILEYDQFVREKLATLNSLGKMKSSVVLSTVKMTHKYPIKIDNPSTK